MSGVIRYSVNKKCYDFIINNSYRPNCFMRSLSCPIPITFHRFIFWHLAVTFKIASGYRTER